MTHGLRVPSSVFLPVARLVALLLATGLLFRATPVEAQRLRVRVVDVVGDRAYLEPGAASGVRRGGRVRFGARSYEVVATTDSYAVIDITGRPIELGARGFTRRGRSREESGARLPEPTPLERFEGQWSPPRRPSESQRPRYVPLTSASASQRVRLEVRSTSAASIPLGGDGPALYQTRLRARLDARLTPNAPLRLTTDAALQLYFGDVDQRRADASRPIVLARQLQLSYGEDRAFYAAIGRLRSAASMLGTLDGARVSAPEIAGLRISAFGGAIPEPTSGVPAFDAARFGVGLDYAKPDHAWRPSASLVAYGSTFSGSLDERRLAGSVRLLPGPVSTGAHAELAFFDANNPWDAPVAQLLSASVDASAHHGLFHWALRGDYRVPERSRWLASFLPAGYFCVADTDPTACAGGHDPRWSANADVELRGAKLAGGAMASYVTAPERDTNQWMILAHLRAVRIAEIARVRWSASVTRGSLLDVYSTRIALGAALLEGKLDVEAYYRPALRFYTADIRSGFDHRAGAQVLAALARDWQLAFVGDVLLGRDLDALLLQLHLVWRPTFGADG
ncbi:MAG: hypothetical protein R3B99_33830 [Polyangiales bacterium]